MKSERLQKILSAAGVASRRAAEELIRGGRVSVNGEVVTELGTKADPASDRISVDGRPVAPSGERVYLLLYKPRGYVSTLSDPEGRPTIRDLLPRGAPRVYHVGRLDFNTEGLLLLTNDGTLAEHVAHPRYGCEKRYIAKVSGIPSPEVLAKLRSGVPLDGVRTAPASVELMRSTRRDGNAWLALGLREGRSREVRRMLASVGHPVSKLKRVAIGPLTDRGLKPGEIRDLTRGELAALKRVGPVAKGGPTPVAKGGPTPVAKGGPTPVAKGGPTPVAKGGPTPVAKGGPTPVASKPPRSRPQRPPRPQRDRG